jgi:hypothetical protein
MTRVRSAFTAGDNTLDLSVNMFWESDNTNGNPTPDTATQTLLDAGGANLGGFTRNLD